jgi:capsule polysaccharide export protein KpsE/RkpR
MSAEKIKALGKEIGGQLISEGKSFVKEVTSEFEELMQQIGADLAEQQVMALLSASTDTREEHKRNIRFLVNEAASYWEEKKLDFADKGEAMLKTALQWVGKTLIATILPI